MDEAPPRGFPVEEFEARTAKAQRLMAETGFDALLLCTEAEVRYFSGFLTPFWQSPARPWFLIVPREGKPVAVIPGIGETLMRTAGHRARAAAIDQEEAGYCRVIRHSNPGRRPWPQAAVELYCLKDGYGDSQCLRCSQGSG